MGIKKLKNGIWEAFVSIRHPETRKPKNTRRKSIMVNGVKKPITSKTLARRVERELHHEIMMSFKKEVVPTVEKAYLDFIDWSKKQGLDEGTVQNRKLCLNAHVVSIWGTRLVDEISSNEIRDLINTNLAKHSSSQKKNVLKYIRLMFQFLVDNGTIGKNPTPKMKFQIGNKLKACLTPSEARNFLEHANEVDSEWYPVWATAVYSGMRNAELLGLTWNNVSFELNQIKVVQTYKPKLGKFDTTKSTDERIIDIAPPLLPILKELKLRNMNPPFVLPRIDKWDKGEQARELRIFLMGMGLPVIRFHDLRATWATILLSQGVPATIVMAMGGWKDIKTIKHYLRMSGVDTKGALQGLNLHNPFKKVGDLLKLTSRNK